MISPLRLLSEPSWVVAEIVDALREQGLTYPEMAELTGRPATELILSQALAFRAREELERMIRIA